MIAFYIAICLVNLCLYAHCSTALLIGVDSATVDTLFSLFYDACIMWHNKASCLTSIIYSPLYKHNLLLKKRCFNIFRGMSYFSCFIFVSEPIRVRINHTEWSRSTRLIIFVGRFAFVQRGWKGLIRGRERLLRNMGGCFCIFPIPTNGIDGKSFH